MTHMLEEWLKVAVEENEKKRALKKVFKATLRDQVATLTAAKKRVAKAKRARTATEKRAANLEGKLGDVKVKLAQAKSIDSIRDKEVADLKVTLVQSEDKFYNIGFANTKNSSEPIMLKSRHYGFGEGWMATINALGLPEDFPSNRYPNPSPRILLPSRTPLKMKRKIAFDGELKIEPSSIRP